LSGQYRGGVRPVRCREPVGGSHPRYGPAGLPASLFECACL
jgi:hypothetical protein